LILIADKIFRKKLFFLNSLRISILTILLFVSFITLIFSPTSFPIQPVITALIVSLLLSVINIPLGRLLRPRPLIFLQVSFDILLITALVYFTGGIVSPFYFLYILPIIVASVFLDRRDTITVATLSFIVFGLLCDLLFLEIIPSFSPSEGLPVPFATFIYNLVMGFIAFASVSLLASYFFERLRRTGEELKNVQDNLLDVMKLNNSVMEKMQHGLVTSDADGRIISYNEKAKILLNLVPDANFFAQLTENEQRALRRLPESANQFHFEKRIGVRDLAITVSVLEEISTFERILVFLITDMTSIKAIERKLKEREHLALIGEMAASIAHEIRNPLASISASVQFLRKELSLDGECKNLMNIIVRESERLSRSIEEFLNFSRMSPPDRKEFDLAALLDDTIGMLAMQFPSVRFQRNYPPGVSVTADPVKIKQLIWNLLSNAVKASREHGTVEAAVYHSGPGMCLTIRDNGIGMDREEMERVYTPFYSRFTSGIGLGMSIVRRIVDEHGFTIDIHSGKNIGTEVTVCFTLPPIS
jgi:two-component system, NtrC family, sensor histidine kinase PilS